MGISLSLEQRRERINTMKLESLSTEEVRSMLPDTGAHSELMRRRKERSEIGAPLCIIQTRPDFRTGEMRDIRSEVHPGAVPL